MKARKIALLALLFSWAPVSLAGVIDFENQPFGNVAGETLVIESDGVTVTFTGIGLQIRTLGGGFDETYCQSRYLSTSGDSEEITVTFSSSVNDVTILNPINGSVTGEIDEIDGEAYDAGDALLDSFSNADVLPTLIGPGITRVTYDDVSDGNGYVIGALSFNEPLAPCATTPVPAMSPLGLSALVMLSLIIGAQVIRRRGISPS